MAYSLLVNKPAAVNPRHKPSEEVSVLKFSVTAAESVPRTAPILLRGDLYKSIDTAIEIGYAFMEIHIRTADQVDSIRMTDYCKERDFRISTIGTGMGYVLDKLSLTDVQRSVRNEAVQRLKTHIDLAEKLECGVIIGSMKGSIPDMNDYHRYEHYCLDCMKQLADYAGSKKVSLYFEVINRYEVNFLNSIENTLEFITKVNNPWVSILIDTFHMNIEEKNFAESIAQCGNMLGHVHVADSNRMYPGGGHIDFVQVLKALENINYEGYVALECLPAPDPYTAALNGLSFLQDLYHKRIS